MAQNIANAIVKNEVHNIRLAVSFFFFLAFGFAAFESGLLLLSNLEGLFVDMVISDSLLASVTLYGKEKNNLVSGCSAPFPIPLNVTALKKFQRA